MALKLGILKQFLIKCAVVADCLNRATFHGLYGKVFFSLGLFCYK
jgi:hypothetical protein